MVSEQTILENLIMNWEKEYQEKREHFSDRQLLEIFPEAREYLEGRIIRLEKEIGILTSRIQKDLKKTFKFFKGFSRFFLQEMIKVWEGDRLDKLVGEYKKLKWLLCPPIPKGKGQITAEDIERAREQPFERFIEVKNKFWALCPFHSDKNPSLYLKNNFYHCFGCGKSGDIIDFVMETRGLDFVQAVKLLIN